MKIFVIVFYIFIYSYCSCNNYVFALCECMNADEDKSLSINSVKNHEAVFSGRVAKIVYVNQDDYVAKFIVYESWKKDHNKKYMYVLGSTHPDECSIPLIIGHEYIVFAKKAGTLFVLSNCSPTQEFDEVDKEDLYSMGKPENIIYPRYAITRRISYIEDIKN